MDSVSPSSSGIPHPETRPATTTKANGQRRRDIVIALLLVESIADDIFLLNLNLYVYQKHAISV
jgi:hypothetical protein